MENANKKCFRNLIYGVNDDIDRLFDDISDLITNVSYETITADTELGYYLRPRGEKDALEFILLIREMLEKIIEHGNNRRQENSQHISD